MANSELHVTIYHIRSFYNPKQQVTFKNIVNGGKEKLLVTIILLAERKTIVTTIFPEKCFLHVSFRQQLMHVLQKS